MATTSTSKLLAQWGTFYNLFGNSRCQASAECDPLLLNDGVIGLPVSNLNGPLCSLGRCVMPYMYVLKTTPLELKTFSVDVLTIMVASEIVLTSK